MDGRDIDASEPHHPQQQREWIEVADVRRSLCQLRRLWLDNEPDTPFQMSKRLRNVDMDLTEFCFQFVVQHHSKKRKTTPPSDNNAAPLTS